MGRSAGGCAPRRAAAEHGAIPDFKPARGSPDTHALCTGRGACAVSGTVCSARSDTQVTAQSRGDEVLELRASAWVRDKSLLRHEPQPQAPDASRPTAKPASSFGVDDSRRVAGASSFSSALRSRRERPSGRSAARVRSTEAIAARPSLPAEHASSVPDVVRTARLAVRRQSGARQLGLCRSVVQHCTAICAVLHRRWHSSADRQVCMRDAS